MPSKLFETITKLVLFPSEEDKIIFESLVKKGNISSFKDCLKVTNEDFKAGRH